MGKEVKEPRKKAAGFVAATQSVWELNPVRFNLRRPSDRSSKWSIGISANIHPDKRSSDRSSKWSIGISANIHPDKRSSREREKERLTVRAENELCA